MKLAASMGAALPLLLLGIPRNDRQAAVDSAEARAIAQEAYIYGFPVVKGYRTLHAQTVDADDPSFKAPFNVLAHVGTPATPEFEEISTPNSDTLYSFLWMDLRAEPVVIALPEIEAERYYSAQLVDLYTHNFAYLGTRAFGNGGGRFLVAGPDWRGGPPEGIRAVLRCETRLAYAVFRTQLFGPADLEQANRVQAGYAVQPLSDFLGAPPPPASPAVAWPEPAKGMTETPALFGYLNFLLEFCPTHPSETGLMARFARLGIGAGQEFDADRLSSNVKAAVEAGIADARKELAVLMKRFNAGEASASAAFGTREALRNDYLLRFAGARHGIYGNSPDEVMYLGYFVDADRRPLDASKRRYELRFGAGQLPPARAFWSLTMYDGKTHLLAPNPQERYQLGSPLLDSFRFGADGSLTLHLQADSPGAALEPNWLPAPRGPFYAVLRLYLPEAQALDGTWKQPPLASTP